MTPQRAGAWICRHPVRFGVYIGLAAGAIGAALLARSILQGRGDNLLTRLAQSGAAIAPRWGIRPTVESVSLRRNHSGCAYLVAVASPALSFTDPRAARLSARSTELCLASKGARISATEGLLGDVNHPDLLRAGVLDFDQAIGQARIQGAHWRPGSGQILATVAGAVVSPGAGLAKATEVDVLPRPESSLARIRESRVAGVVFRERKLAIRSAAVEGVGARFIETAGRWNFEQLLPQLQSGGRELSEIAGRTAAAVRRSLRGIRSDLWAAFWVTAAAAFFLKLSVTRTPSPWRWRIALAVAPVLLGYILGVWLPAGRSLPGRTIIVFICSTALAIVLWWFYYRRAAEWHQRWEPAVVVLLAPCPLALILFAHAWISGVAVPELPQAAAVSIAAAEARAVNAHIRTSSCGEAATASILSASVAALEAHTKPGSFDLEALSWGEAAARGFVSSPLLKDLRDMRYLPAQWRSPPSLSFCVSATTNGQAAQQEACEPPAAAYSVRAAVVLDPVGRSAGFHSNVRLQEVAFRARGDADLSGVRLHQLRSVPGSRIAVESGSGVLTVGPDLDATIRLRGIQASGGSSSARIASAELRARLPRPCEAGRIEAEGLLRSLAVALPGGYGVEAASVNLKATRADSIGLSFVARSASVRGERPGETGPWLVADFPSTSLEVTGTPIAGRSLRYFDGKAVIALSGDAGPVLGLSRPIEFTADLRRGEFTVREQRTTLRQSVTSRLDPSLDVQLSARAGIESLRPVRAAVNSAISVSSLSPRVDPFELELKGLSARITGTPGEPLRAGFRSGTNTLYLPALPAGLEIDRIDRVHLLSQGRAITIPSFDAIRADLGALDDWRGHALPRVPERVEFHIAGDWEQNGSVTLAAATQSGASISGSLESGVRGLQLPAGRLGLLETGLLARRLRTGRHGGDLQVSVRSKVTDDRVEASLPAEAGLSPAASLNLTQGQLEFKLLRPLELSGLVARTNPFLKEAGVDLDGIDPQAVVSSLDAKASFQRRELRNHTIALRLRQGPLATIDFRRLLPPIEPRFLESVTLALNADSDLTFEGSTGHAHASADIRGLRVNVNEGAETATLSAFVRQPFVAASRVSSIDPAWRRRVSDAGEGLRHHLMRAADILGNGSSDIKNLRWDFTLDTRDDQPLFQWGRDRLQLAFQSNWSHLSATIAGGARPFVLRGSLAPDIVLSSHQEHVVADAAVSADLAGSVSGGPERKWKGEFPLHIAITSGLRPALGESPQLWDTKFYESFWSTYRPVHPPRSVSLIDQPEVLAGGFAVREIRFPSGPLQLALGFEGPLQLHFPFQGRALFGEAGGLLQARLEWGENDVSVDAFARVGFRDLEAGAFGRAGGSGPGPIIEDKMEGTFDLRTTGFRFRPALVDALRADASRVSELDKVSFSLALDSAPRRRPGPGVLQAHVDVRAMPGDEGLRELFDAIRRLTPRASPLRYETLSFRLDASDGLVNTRSPLLHLRGIDVRGPLPVQGDLRVMWGHTPGFAGVQPRLRNLVYFFQRAFPDRPGQ